MENTEKRIGELAKHKLDKDVEGRKIADEMMKQMAQKVIETIPEDSPLQPLIKGGDDLALISILLAVLFLPTDELKKIAQEMMTEIKGDN